MATSWSCIKCLKSACETCTWNSSFPEVLYKWSVLKNFSKFRDKDNKQSYRGALSKEKIFLKILQNSHKNIFVGVSFLIKLQAGKLQLPEAATGDVV